MGILKNPELERKILVITIGLSGALHFTFFKNMVTSIVDANLVAGISLSVLIGALALYSAYELWNRRTIFTG